MHRFVFAHRTHGLAEPAGQGLCPHDPAAVRPLLRAITSRTASSTSGAESPIRALMPKLLDQYKLAGTTLGQPRSGRCGRRGAGPHDLSRPAGAVGRSGRRGAGRRDQPRGRRRSDFAGLEPARPAARPGQLADARRFGRRPLVRRHQRLAQHGPRRRAAARGQRPDRRRLSRGDPHAVQDRRLSHRRAPRDDQDDRCREAARRSRRRHPQQRPGPGRRRDRDLRRSGPLAATPSSTGC